MVPFTKGGIMEEKTINKSTTRRDFWKSHIESWEFSGLSAAEYCRSHSLKYLTFLGWKKKFNPSQTEQDAFVEIPFPGAGTDSNNRIIELTLEPDFHFRLKINFGSDILRQFLSGADKNVSGNS